MQYEFRYGSETYTVDLEKKGKVYQAKLGDREFTVDACKVSERLLSFIVDGRSVLAHLARGETGWVLGLSGKQYVLEDPSADDERAAGGAGGGGGDGKIVTPMPGKVVEVLVEEGAEVTAGQALLILESMKMQNEINADVDGVVKTVHFKAGDLANFGDPLVEIEPAE